MQLAFASYFLYPKTVQYRMMKSVSLLELDVQVQQAYAFALGFPCLIPMCQHPFQPNVNPPNNFNHQSKFSFGFLLHWTVEIIVVDQK